MRASKRRRLARIAGNKAVARPAVFQETPLQALRAELQAQGEIDYIKNHNPKWAKGPFLGAMPDYGPPTRETLTRLTSQARPNGVRHKAQDPNFKIFSRDKITLPEVIPAECRSVGPVWTHDPAEGLRAKDWKKGDPTLIGAEYGFILVGAPF